MAVLLVALVGPGAVRAYLVLPYSQVGSEPVVAGVVHEWGTTQTDLATQQVNVLRVGAGAPDVHFETGLPSDRVNARQKTSAAAAAATYADHRVVGAVNGDFWATSPTNVYAPVGLNIRDGELITGNVMGRGALGFDAAGTPIIGQPHLAVTITLPDSSTFPVTGVNQLRNADGLILYSSRFGPSTGTDATGVEVVLSGAPSPLSVTSAFGAAVAQVLTGAGDTALGPGALVLSGVGAGAAPLAALLPGDQIGLSISIEPEWQTVMTAVGGGALLVHEGQAIETYDRPNDLTPNPRTAAGIGTDGSLILVTVDGRSENSGGMPLVDLAQVMTSMGAVEAVNLDGGGSTTMAVDPEGAAQLGVANGPSAGYERRVSTTLQIISTAHVMPSVSAPVARLTPGLAAGRSDAAVEISWTAADPDGQIAGAELQRLAADGTWLDIALTDPAATSVSHRQIFGRAYQYRVRVTDDQGIVSQWSVSVTYRIVSFSERDPAVMRAGKWGVDYRRSAIGRHFARNSVKSGAGQSVALPFSGVQVGWVAPTGRLGGTADVQLDGGHAATVDLYSSIARARMVVFVGPAIDPAAGVSVAQRTVAIVNVSARSRPFVNLDSLLVLTAE